MKIQGVLFDMDGLLLDSERLVVVAFQKTASEMHLPDLTTVVHQMIGLRSDAGARVLRAALAGLADHDEFDLRWRRHIQRVFDTGIPLKTGVIAVLENLHQLALPCAVATSTKTANAEKHLRKAGITQYFQSVTGGDQVNAGKPAPDIYHHAAASIGLTASQCAAFEDSDPGATAAHLSGALTIQVPDINPPAPAMHTLGHIIAPSLIDGARRIGLTANP